MENLPWDILSDILVPLPMKSTAQFRCVNKGWCNLLKSPEFLKTQYKYAVEMDRFSLMFHNQNDIYTYRYDPLSSTCEASGHVEYPVKSLNMGIEYYGCCNGLIFLRHINKFNSVVLIVWNPTTNECKKLPNPPSKLMERLGGFVEYGFGYDYQVGDFKVVRIAQGFTEGWCEVQVFSLKSNSWRRLEDIQVDKFSYEYQRPDIGRLPAVTGAYHWKALVGGDLGTENILRFDFEKEEFDMIPIPDEIDEYFLRHLCILGGSLWLVNDEYGCCLEFWEFKDNGVEKSWTNPFTIGVGNCKLLEDTMPIKILENGKILLGSDRHKCSHLVLYDLKHETARLLKIHRDLITNPFLTSVYVESLISLNTGTYLGQVQWGEVDEDDS